MDLSTAGDSKIMKCILNYDDHIPEVSLTQYLFDVMSPWENCVAIVSFIYHIIQLKDAIRLN